MEMPCGPVATYEWICSARRATVQAMKDHVSTSAMQVRIPETISVAAAVLLPIVQGSYPFTLFILSFVLMFFAQPARSENAPEFRGNTEHSGVYEAVGVPKFSQVKWTFHANGQLISSPAVDGATIYVGRNGGGL